MKEALGKEADLVGCHLSHHLPRRFVSLLHVGFGLPSDEEAEAKLDKWWEVGMQTCLGAGGSISHHHGIGRRKAAWMSRELGGWWDVLRR